MANFITDSFFILNDPQRFSNGLVEAIQSVPNDGIFASDNLFTWGRSLGFLSDAAFMDAVMGNNPNMVEKGCIWRLHTLCWAARQCSRLPGDYVEAGCYKGFSAKVICDYLQFQQLGRRYFLYDLFMHDSSMNHHAMPEHGEGLFEWVKQRFQEYPQVSVFQGGLPGALAQGAPEQIAFMHIDMNNAEAEVGVLEALFDKVVPGGMIVFDDYGWLCYSEQKHAEDAWLQKYHERILELPTGQGLLVKH